MQDKLKKNNERLYDQNNEMIDVKRKANETLELTHGISREILAQRDKIGKGIELVFLNLILKKNYMLLNRIKMLNQNYLKRKDW